jgi:hypothetical protein
LFDRTLTRKEGNHYARYHIAMVGMVDAAQLGMDLMSTTATLGLNGDKEFTVASLALNSFGFV